MITPAAAHGCGSSSETGNGEKLVKTALKLLVEAKK